MLIGTQGTDAVLPEDELGDKAKTFGVVGGACSTCLGSNASDEAAVGGHNVFVYGPAVLDGRGVKNRLRNASCMLGAASESWIL
jgi:hypothetical protein